MVDSAFRRAVMHELDVAYTVHGPDTPDHIIVSKSIWSDMKANNKFETLRSTDHIPERRLSAPGYMGMRVWHSRALDRRDKSALLMSEDVFKHFFDQAKDL